MAPEALGNKPVYGVKLDVFSYAGIILFVSTHKWPTPADQVQLDPETDKPVALSEVERRQEYLDEMTREADGLRPIVESCLSNNTAKRPTIAEVSKTIKVIERIIIKTLSQKNLINCFSSLPVYLLTSHCLKFHCCCSWACIHNFDVHKH